MDPAPRPATKGSTNNNPATNGTQSLATPPVQGSTQLKEARPQPPLPPTPAAPTEKRLSKTNHPHTRNEQPAPKRTGFGLFGGKSKDDEDDKEQLKRLKADNKQLQAQLRELEIKSKQMGVENERYKSTILGDRKINNQLHPDSYYGSALEHLSVGITDWTVTHFRGRSSREYTAETVEEIRSGLKKLSESNNLIPPTLLWTDVDLQSALRDSKFRIAFVLHVISLHLHEKIFSPFSYQIEDFGLGYWLKRICDDVTKSEELDGYFKWDWSKALFRTIPGMFDGKAVEGRIMRRLKRILRPIHPRDSPPDDAIFDKLQEYIAHAIEIAVSMRLEQGRFVSTFPIQGAVFQPPRHSTGGEDQKGAIRMCTFPGIIKQSMFLGASVVSDISIFKARVHLESTFQHLELELPTPDEEKQAETATK